MTRSLLRSGAEAAIVTQACELFGPLLLADDLTREGIKYQDGHVLVPDASGLGVTLGDAKLQRYGRRG